MRHLIISSLRRKVHTPTPSTFFRTTVLPHDLTALLAPERGWNEAARQPELRDAVISPQQECILQPRRSTSFSAACHHHCNWSCKRGEQVPWEQWGSHEECALHVHVSCDALTIHFRLRTPRALHCTGSGSTFHDFGACA